MITLSRDGTPRGDAPPRVTTVAGIAEAGPHAWGRLAAGAGLYQSYEWLHWTETFTTAAVRYVLAYDDAGELVGATPTYLLTRPPDRFTTWYDPIRLFLAPHGPTAGADARWYPLLLVGSVSGYHSEFLVRPGGDRRAVTEALVRGSLAVAAEAGARSVAMLYAPSATARESGPAFGGVTVPTSAEAVITLPAGGGAFDDYLARFPSARRSKLRKEAVAFARAAGEVARYSLGEVAHRVGPLLGRLQRRYGDPVRDAEMTAYLAGQAEFLDERSLVFAAESGGRLTGFTLCYVHDDTLYVRAAGFDEEAALPFGYFNLSVYAPVRHALAHGLTEVDLGTGAYQGKTLRGAEIRPLWSLVRPPGESPAAWHEALRRPAPEAREAGWPEAHETETA
ncbi:GNAT family N-acetyltransferase [Streptomyces sp. PRKS01-65]|nr:GNAT family N-acetyltransferase [Streptomyces harenosi]NEY30957.1 GNAT family N-acetyltransferase [Streptomyces harenosi]